VLVFTLLLVIVIAFVVYFKYLSNESIKIIDLKSNSKRLLFYGSVHSNNKVDPMFTDIESKFNSTKPQVVLVEGDANIKEYTDRDNAIKNGESAYVSYLAQKNSILAESIEPSLKDQYQYLLNKYDKDRVLLMYILRQIHQFQGQDDSKSIVFKRELQSYIYGMVSAGFPLDENEAKIDNIMSLLESYLKEDIDDGNWKSIDVRKYVLREETDLNGIYNEVYEFRNKSLESKIEMYLKKYDRVFVIMGNQHLRDEETHIKEIFSKLSK
jgi:hypothetical protein